jgi:hypothetical protein
MQHQMKSSQFFLRFVLGGQEIFFKTMRAVISKQHKAATVMLANGEKQLLRIFNNG